MPSLKVLIVGGGVAGPSLAYWLAQTGHEVTVVERFPSLRAKGAQIDIRAQGIDIVKRMGLLEAVKKICVDEDGVGFVDTNGKLLATIRANKSGKGAQSLTSEYEIMRGDLVTLLYQYTKDNVKYIFGTTVDSFTQDFDGVTANFSDGSSSTYDVLVGADGQGSRIRQKILPPDYDPYVRVGIMMAYWMIPAEPADLDKIRKSYRIPGGGMMLRNHAPHESQIYLNLRDDEGEYRSIPRASFEQQKEFWTSKFRGAGWQSDRFMKSLETTDNFYCQEVLQVKTDTWHKGRVVLLADAAHCPSPMSGMGTTSAFVGAYVLAGEINRHSEDLSKAFASYDEVMRPFVKECQKLIPGFKNFFVPKTQLGITLLTWVFTIVCWLRIPDLMARFSSEDKGGWKVPVYSELHSKERE